MGLLSEDQYDFIDFCVFTLSAEGGLGWGRGVVFGFGEGSLSVCVSTVHDIQHRHPAKTELMLNICIILIIIYYVIYIKPFLLNST